MTDAQKAGLVVNWIGRQCVMTLHSMGIELDKPKSVFDSLEKIFHPESNQTLSRFKFRGLKQKATQSCDSYMSELRLTIVECHYPDIVQDKLLKDQFIFGLLIKEIQDHLLREILAKTADFDKITDFDENPWFSSKTTDFDGNLQFLMKTMDFAENC